MCECVCVLDTLWVLAQRCAPESKVHKVHLWWGTKMVSDYWYCVLDRRPEVCHDSETLLDTWTVLLTHWPKRPSVCDCNDHIHEAYGGRPGSSRSAAALLPPTEQSWLCVKGASQNVERVFPRCSTPLHRFKIPSGIFPLTTCRELRMSDSRFGSFTQAHWTNNLLSLN